MKLKDITNSIYANWLKDNVGKKIVSITDTSSGRKAGRSTIIDNITILGNIAHIIYRFDKDGKMTASSGTIHLSNRDFKVL